MEKFNNSYNEPNIWFVTQGDTFTKDKGMMFLWAPEKGKDGRGRFFWENLLKVKKGDFIFNYSGGIKGVSIALSDGYKAENVDSISQWNKNGYKVDIDFIELNPPITANQLSINKVEMTSNLSNISNKPFNINGGVNQGYLFEFTKEAGKYLRNIYGKKFGNEIIDDFFDNVEETKMNNINNSNLKFNTKNFITNIEVSGLFYSDLLVNRLISSILTKPFVILTGLSGSGKTKIAQAFVQWICENKSQYLIIPVGADWTNREPLLGYPNGLNAKEYITPESGVINLLLEAVKVENNGKPFFLILDEMNLSHIERYFADFLSIMETNDTIKLYTGNERFSLDGFKIPFKIGWPKNLFIIGTVNIDETTYMFSPKVLDRANTIEFRLTEKDIEDFISSDINLNMDILTAKGANMAKSFMEMALQPTSKNFKATKNDLTLFFTGLKKSGAEFGYRTASEIGRLMFMLEELGETGDNLLDVAIMQKLLPKLHGSRNKLTKVLPILGGFCLKDNSKIKEAYLDKFVSNSITEKQLNADSNIKYHISFEKICRMYKNAVENGFASYAEA